MLKRRMRGVTLIEMMIALSITALLLVMGLPAFRTFLQNTQIKNAAESTLAGITLARAEALRRNTTVRFQLVSDLTGACALSATSLNWVVSLADAASNCNDDPLTAPAQIIQVKSAKEGYPNVNVTTAGGAVIVFNGLGRVTGAGITQVDFTNTAGACEHVDATNGTMRCLRIMVSTGGQAKLCDPKVPVQNPMVDPRQCA